MDHADHVALIRDGVADGGTVWADLGSGAGAFTLALADLLRPGSTIHSVDSWTGLAARAGLRDTRRIGTIPSRFLGAIYSAVSVA